MSDTPIFDALTVEQPGEAVNSLALELYLEDWYHDRGYFND